MMGRMATVMVSAVLQAISELAPCDSVIELEARSLIEPMRIVKSEIESRVRQ